MTQPQLAAAAGIKQPSLSELETGETKEISGPVLISLSKALRVRPEWLMTGDEPIEPDPGAAQSTDEREVLELYRGASSRWKIAIKYMAGLRNEAKQEEAGAYILSKIFATPVPDERVEETYGLPPRIEERPGKPGEHRFVVQDQESPTYKRTPSKKRGQK